MLSDDIRRLTQLLNESPLDPKLIVDLHILHKRFGIDFESIPSNLAALEKVSAKILDYTNTSRHIEGHPLRSEVPYETLIIPPNYIFSFKENERGMYAVFDIRALAFKDITKQKILMGFKSHPTNGINLSVDNCDFSNLFNQSNRITPSFFTVPAQNLRNLDLLDCFDLMELRKFQVASVEDISKFDYLKLPRYRDTSPYSFPHSFQFDFYTPDIDRLNFFAQKNPIIGFNYHIYKPINIEDLNKLQAQNIRITSHLPSNLGKPYTDLKKYLKLRNM